MKNTIFFSVLALLVLNSTLIGFFSGDAIERVSPATTRLAHLIGNRMSRWLPNRLQDIEDALQNGADTERCVPFELGRLTKPMEIALRCHDWNLVELLLRHGVSLTGAQIVSTFIQGSHGINMPWLMKLVAATARPELVTQLRHELRSHEWFIAAE